MSEVKHSPLPWKAVDGAELIIRAANGRLVANFGGYNSNVPGEEPDEDNRANRDLVLAQAERIKALEEYVERVAIREVVDDCDCEPCCDVLAARALLEKP